MSLQSILSALLHARNVESCIDPDETVVFFPTAACPESDDSPNWEIPIHGWIYRPTELSRLRKISFHLLKQAAKFRFREVDFKTPVFRQRLGAFLADNERSESVSIDVAGWRFTLGKSLPNGHFQGVLELPVDRVEALLQPGMTTGQIAPTPGAGRWLTFRAVMRAADPRHFDGRVLFLPREGLSVISDIDDTIKVTEVLDRKRMLANTFMREFNSVPGMAALYTRWATERGAAFHYLSASPWHLYPFLSEFLAAQGFPAGTFHLRDFRLMPRNLRSTLRSTREVKLTNARELMRRFPGRRFILMGDSGEHDPEVYAALAREFPSQVEGIYIREVGRSRRRGRAATVLQDLPVARDRCRVFEEAGEIG